MTPNHGIIDLRPVIYMFDFVDQPLLEAAKLVISGRQSAVLALIKEMAVKEGEGPLGRLVTEIGRAAGAGGLRPPAWSSCSR